MEDLLGGRSLLEGLSHSHLSTPWKQRFPPTCCHEEKRKREEFSCQRKMRGHDIRRRWLIPRQTSVSPKPANHHSLCRWRSPAATHTRANTQLICGAVHCPSLPPFLLQVPAAPAMQDDPPQEHGTHKADPRDTWVLSTAWCYHVCRHRASI